MSNTPAQKPSPSGRLAHGRPGLVGSLIHAWNGLIHTVLHQRNMRIHLMAGLLVSLVGSGIPLGLAEKVTLIFCVLLVFFAEVLNSALEQLVDLATEQLHPRARIAKDAAAGGVLILVLGTVAIFAAVVFHNIDTVVALRPRVRQQVVLGLPLVGCAWLLVKHNARAAWLDIAISITAVLLWQTLATVTYSSVFSAMSLGLLIICMHTAWRRRHPGGG